MKPTAIFKTGMSLLLVASLSVTTYANSAISPLSNNASNEDKRMVESMKFEVPANINTVVSVIDNEGSVIYTDNIKKDNNIAKTYDFSNVKDGVYTIKTETEFKTVKKIFEVEEDDLTILNEEKKYRPVFKLNGDILTVTYINLNENNVSLSLEGQSLVHFEENGGNEQAYGKILNLKKLPQGEYSVALTAGGNTYNYFFNR